MPATASIQPPSPIAHLTSPDSPSGTYRVTAEKREGGRKEGNTFPTLQGVVEKTPGGEWLMRCESGTSMPDGGKVLLEGHPRLDLFENGTIIRVEGRMIDEGSGRNAGAWLPHPRYNVERVYLIRRLERSPLVERADRQLAERVDHTLDYNPLFNFFSSAAMRSLHSFRTALNPFGSTLPDRR
jgi:hypothetical protein